MRGAGWEVGWLMKRDGVVVGGPTVHHDKGLQHFPLHDNYATLLVETNIIVAAVWAGQKKCH